MGGRARIRMLNSFSTQNSFFNLEIRSRIPFTNLVTVLRRNTFMALLRASLLRTPPLLLDLWLLPIRYS